MDSSSTSTLTATDRLRYVRHIRDEQIGLVYSRLPLIAVVSVTFSSIAVCLALWDLVTAAELACWLSVNAVIAAGFVALNLRFKRARTTEFSRLPPHLIAAFVVLGTYWATVLTYYMVRADSMPYHLYIYIFWGGMGTLAVSMLSDYLPSFYAFILPPSVALIGFALVKFAADYLSLAMATLFALVAMASFATGKNRSLSEGIHLRFAMADLAEEANRQRDAADRATIAKSKFLAAASHDLRQPLHALSLLTSALNATATSDEVRHIGNDLQASVTALDKLFNALLDVSRLDAGVLQPNLRHFDLDALLVRLTSEYVAEGSAKNLKLRYEPRPYIAYSDPVLLESILRNYLSNAVRYTIAGSVSIVTHTSTSGIRVEVHDTGVGIPLAQQNDIFSEFYQIGNPERDRNKGLGLGLAIVRRTAQLLNHEIGVHSVPGGGSCFHVVVPAGDTSRMISEVPVVAPTLHVRGLCVLVIDDDASIRDGMRTLLSTWGCECVAVSNDDEALELVREDSTRIDAIIADYRLRNDRTGVEAVANVRAALQATIPALLVSGDTAPERLKEAVASGLMLVHKPVQPQVIKVFLANAARRLRAQ